MFKRLTYICEWEVSGLSLVAFLLHLSLGNGYVVLERVLLSGG